MKDLPGASLQKACRLIVVFCFLHLSVVFLYYFAGSTLNLQWNPEPAPRGLTPPHREPLALKTNLSKLDTDCPDPSPLLVGPLRVEFSQTVNLKNVEAENPEVREGGRYTPQNCRALQKVAIIIPFRNRDEHLKYWLSYLHPILQRQQLDYGVYVINQNWNGAFLALPSSILQPTALQRPLKLAYMRAANGGGVGSNCSPLHEQKGSSGSSRSNPLNCETCKKFRKC